MFSLFADGHLIVEGGTSDPAEENKHDFWYNFVLPLSTKVVAIKAINHKGAGAILLVSNRISTDLNLFPWKCITEQQLLQAVGSSEQLVQNLDWAQSSYNDSHWPDAAWMTDEPFSHSRWSWIWAEKRPGNAHQALENETIYCRGKPGKILHFMPNVLGTLENNLIYAVVASAYFDDMF